MDNRKSQPAWGLTALTFRNMSRLLPADRTCEADLFQLGETKRKKEKDLKEEQSLM